MSDTLAVISPCRAHFYTGKDTPTLGEELREVFRYLFSQPERRLRATDFVWSYEELSDDVPD